MNEIERGLRDSTLERFTINELKAEIDRREQLNVAKHMLAYRSRHCVNAIKVNKAVRLNGTDWMVLTPMNPNIPAFRASLPGRRDMLEPVREMSMYYVLEGGVGSLWSRESFERNYELDVEGDAKEE